jgi:hypothetical protein
MKPPPTYILTHVAVQFPSARIRIKTVELDPCVMFSFDIRLPYISSLPRGLEDVSRYPYLLAELMADARWTDEDIKKVAGLNFLRVFGKVEKVRIFNTFSSKQRSSIQSYLYLGTQLVKNGCTYCKKYLN